MAMCEEGSPMECIQSGWVKRLNSGVEEHHSSSYHPVTGQHCNEMVEIDLHINGPVPKLSAIEDPVRHFFAVFTINVLVGKFGNRKDRTKSARLLRMASQLKLRHEVGCTGYTVVYLV